MSNRNRNTFTLIELLVVIAIISILASMLLPVLRHASYKAKIIVCSNNLKQTGVATTLYTADYDGQFPRSASCTRIYSPDAPLVFTDGTQAVSDQWPMYTLITSYLGGNIRALFCPDADVSRASPWFGQDPFRKMELDGRYAPRWGAPSAARTLTAWGYEKYVGLESMAGNSGVASYRPGFAAAPAPNRLFFTSRASGLGWYPRGYFSLQEVSRSGRSPIVIVQYRCPYYDFDRFDSWRDVPCHVFGAMTSTVIPLEVAGRNELLVDGHVKWFANDVNNAVPPVSMAGSTGWARGAGGGMNGSFGAWDDAQ